MNPTCFLHLSRKQRLQARLLLEFYGTVLLPRGWVSPRQVIAVWQPETGELRGTIWERMDPHGVKGQAYKLGQGPRQSCQGTTVRRPSSQIT